MSDIAAEINGKERKVYLNARKQFMFNEIEPLYSPIQK